MLLKLSRRWTGSFDLRRRHSAFDRSPRNRGLGDIGASQRLDDCAVAHDMNDIAKASQFFRLGGHNNYFGASEASSRITSYTCSRPLTSIPRVGSSNRKMSAAPRSQRATTTFCSTRHLRCTGWDRPRGRVFPGVGTRARHGRDPGFHTGSNPRNSDRPCSREEIREGHNLSGIRCSAHASTVHFSSRRSTLRRRPASPRTGAMSGPISAHQASVTPLGYLG